MRRCRTIAPALKALFVSGDACGEDKTTPPSLDPILPKPFTPVQLVEGVRELIRRRGRLPI